MTDRKKLIYLLVKVCPLPYKEIGKIADHLIENGLTFGACVPGPREDNPNIMELCFHNGERNMKEKVMKFLEEL